MKRVLLFAAVVCLVSGVVCAGDIEFRELGSQSFVLDFGEVSQPAQVTRTITVINTSGYDIESFSVNVTGPITKGPVPSATIENSGCSPFIFIGDSCALQVTFEPQRHGRFKGKLAVEGLISTDDGSTRDVSEALSIIGQDLPNQ